jgi:N-acyl homoserine lactone hydrolase
VVVVGTGPHSGVIAGDVAVWLNQLDEPQTEGQRLAHAHEPWRSATG